MHLSKSPSRLPVGWRLISFGRGILFHRGAGPMFVRSPVEGHVGGLQVFAIMSQAARNILVQLSRGREAMLRFVSTAVPTSEAAVPFRAPTGGG